MTISAALLVAFVTATLSFVVFTFGSLPVAIQVTGMRVGRGLF